LKASPMPMAFNSNATEGGVGDLMMPTDASSAMGTACVCVCVGGGGLAEETTGSDCKFMTTQAIGGGTSDLAVAAKRPET
jgi:hypothetical protein